jgi:hypothetical protein
MSCLIGRIADCGYTYAARLFEQAEHVGDGPRLRARFPAQPGRRRGGPEVAEADAPAAGIVERSDLGWERYRLDELISLVERPVSAAGLSSGFLRAVG